MFIPSETDIVDATRDVAWEYAAMLAAVLEMVKGHKGPTNHQAQEVFLIHVRSLAEFFTQRVEEFKSALKITPPPPFPLLPREQRWDNIYAVDFCSDVLWDWKAFKDKKLITAINKTLSHMSYARTSGVDPFDGKKHAHGTVMLLCSAWDGFLKSLRPEFRKPLLNGLKSIRKPLIVTACGHSTISVTNSRKW